MMTNCPHCGTPNVDGATFCAACGKAVPSVAPAGPQIVTGGVLPYSAAGQTLVGDELQKQTKKAFGALLAVGIIQIVFGIIVVLALQNSVPPGTDLTTVYVMVFGIGAVFLGLAFWARYNPLPAAIIGLALFVTVHLLDAVSDPTALARGILMKIIIIVILSKAISAGLKHRQLMQSAAAGA